MENETSNSNYESMQTIKTTETDTLKTLNTEKKEEEKNIKENPEKTELKENKQEKKKEQVEIIINDETIGLEFPYLDEMINKKGITSLQWKSLSICSMIYFLEGMHVSLSGLLFVPILQSFKLNTFVGCLVSSSLVFCMAFGALIAGSFSQLKGRKITIIFFLLIISISSTFAIIQHPLILLITRSINGFSLGVIIPIITNHLIEVLPKKFRSFWVISLTFFFSLGAILSTQIIITCNKKYELFYFCISIPSTIIMVIFVLFYEDNPRYLILNHKYDDGIKIIEKYYKDNVKIEENEKQEIIRNVDKGINKEVKLIGKYSFIFKRYKKITMILCFVWSLYSFMVNGGIFNIFMGNAMSSSYIYSDDFDDDLLDSFWAFEILYLIFGFSCLIAGLITEIKICGRKKTILSGFLLSFIFQIIFLIFKFETNGIFFFYIFSLFFINISFNAINTYSMEIYPTRVRDTAMGFLSFVSRMCGFLSNFITIVLFNFWTTWLLYFSIIITFIGIIFSCLLPFDTYNRELDIKLPEKKKPIERPNEEIIMTIK